MQVPGTVFSEAKAVERLLQQESYPISNATGRFVRIVGYGNSSNLWNSITEVDIVGVAASTPDTTAPTISILSPTDSDTYETSTPRVQLTGTAVDDNNVAEVTWSNSIWRFRCGFRNNELVYSGILISWKAPIQSPSAAKDAAGNQASKATLTVVYIAPDTKTPEVTITSPVQVDTYTTGDATISIAGTASDDHDLQQITWSSSTGASGVASGTDNWTIDAIELVEGANVITVTATDAAGNTAQDTITITYAVAPPLNRTSYRQCDFERG